jgi:hypothetical protein
MTRFLLAAPADLNSKAKDMALPGPSTSDLIGVRHVIVAAS